MLLIVFVVLRCVVDCFFYFPELLLRFACVVDVGGGGCVGLICVRCCWMCFVDRVRCCCCLCLLLVFVVVVVVC